MIVMARMPDSVKATLTHRLKTHRVARWPQLARLDVRYRGEYAYVDAVTADDEIWPLCRLRYTGAASRWGFAIHLASRDGYEDSFLPSGLPAGTPRRSPRLLLWPLPRRPHSPDPTPEGLTRGCASTTGTDSGEPPPGSVRRLVIRSPAGDWG